MSTTLGRLAPATAAAHSTGLIPYYQVQRDHPRRPMVEAYGLKAKDVVSPIDGSSPACHRAFAPIDSATTIGST